MHIECKSYRPFEKGALQGFCELYLPGPPGMTIKDIGVFQKNFKRWVNLPQRSYTDREGNQKFAPYVVVDEGAYWSFQEESLKAIDAFLAAKGQSSSEHPVDDDIPF